MEIIDFHAHVLPGIDDGAMNLEESRQLLLSQKEQGIDTVIATPHCLKHISVTEFADKRDAALERVQREFGADVPRIIPGAEVALFYGLSEREDLRKACISGTDYILIEPPMEHWNNWIYEEIYKISIKHHLRPIIAHLDRYIDKAAQMKKIEKLLEMDVIIQINAEALLHFSSRRIVKKIWERKGFFLLGSDCHNMSNRKCEYEKACHAIQKHFGHDALDLILSCGEKIINNKLIY